VCRHHAGDRLAKKIASVPWRHPHPVSARERYRSGLTQRPFPRLAVEDTLYSDKISALVSNQGKLSRLLFHRWIRCCDVVSVPDFLLSISSPAIQAQLPVLQDVLLVKRASVLDRVPLPSNQFCQDAVPPLKPRPRTYCR